MTTIENFLTLVVSVLSAPGAPTALSETVVAPSESHGPRVNLTWSRPQKENGIIRSYNLLYSHTGEPSHIHTETFGPNTFSYSVDVLGGMTYQFYVRAVTTKPGTNASLAVVIPEYGECLFAFAFVKGKVTTQLYNQIIQCSSPVQHFTLIMILMIESV